MPGYGNRFVKLVYGIILAQFIIIAVLLGGLSSEYLSNVYFRIWLDSAYPQLGLLLTGQVDALIIGMAAGGTILLIERMKNEVKTDQRTILTAIQAMASMEAPELLPDHANPRKKRELAGETPEQVLEALEKQGL
jgi:hypothetical protein